MSAYSMVERTSTWWAWDAHYTQEIEQLVWEQSKKWVPWWEVRPDGN